MSSATWQNLDKTNVERNLKHLLFTPQGRTWVNEEKARSVLAFSENSQTPFKILLVTTWQSHSGFFLGRQLPPAIIRLNSQCLLIRNPSLQAAGGHTAFGSNKSVLSPCSWQWGLCVSISSSPRRRIMAFLIAQVSLYHKPGKHFGELVHAPRLWSISTCFFLQEGTSMSNSEDCCQTGWDSPTPGWLMFIRGGWGWGWAGGGVRRSLSWLFPTSRFTSCSRMDSKGPRRLGKSVKSLSQAAHFPICGTCCSQPLHPFILLLVGKRLEFCWSLPGIEKDNDNPMYFPPLHSPIFTRNAAPDGRKMVSWGRNIRLQQEQPMRKVSSRGLGLQGHIVETTENLTCIKTSSDFRLGSKLANLGRVVAQIISYADCSALEGFICGCIIAYSSVMTNQRSLLEFSTATFPITP